jgi:hypothetical protein
MGLLSTDYCLITGVRISQNFTTDQLGYDYKISVGGFEYYISLPEDFLSTYSNLLKTKGHILKGLLYNGIWIEKLTRVNGALLENLINENNILQTPKEKIEALFQYIFKIQEFDGQTIDFDKTKLLDEFGDWNKFYFKCHEEFVFYVEQFQTLGLAIVNVLRSKDGVALRNITLTLEGLRYYNEINEGSDSNICFVAMSFDSELNSVYIDAIKQAIEESGYSSLLIKDEHLPSHVTINDGILSGIKKAKFVIADFTQNKRGVYFEAGYALGRGLKVIYTCKNSQIDIDALHFDTNHYQHILWDDIPDLKQKLIDKINVFIKP